MEKSLKKLLIEYGFTFNKAFGQNFLTDNCLLEEIVELAGVDKNSTVLEIGCGAGALTKVLCKKAKNVIGYEIDERLQPLLNDVLSDFDNYKLVFKDVMKEDLKKLENDVRDEYLLVANLPYYITTPIIMQFLENAKRVKALCIMVQEEVANRLCAKAGTADYGAITVAINLRGSAKIIKRVPREMFTPAPNVDSAVVLISLDREKNKDVDFDSVREVVKCGFSSRRKMLVNNLMNSFKLNRSQAEELLNLSNIPLTIRGEALDENDYVKLSENLKRIKDTI